jgi:Protein of unknown function (DUF3830)
MSKRFEIEFLGPTSVVVTAELLDEEAPIACENLWEAIAEPLRAKLHHGRHCAAELWCYLPQPKEMIPYENSTVFPGPGDVLYYYFIQPPTRQGRWVCDLGIFYSHGQSRGAPGWLPGNVVARLRGGDATIRQLELVAADLLRGAETKVVLRQREGDVEPATSPEDQAAALDGWLARLDTMPGAATETDVTRVVAAAEQFSQDLARWLSQSQATGDAATREKLRAGSRRVAELAAFWRFATDSPPPASWSGSATSYWRAVVRHQTFGDPLPT